MEGILDFSKELEVPLLDNVIDAMFNQSGTQVQKSLVPWI